MYRMPFYVAFLVFLSFCVVRGREICCGDVGCFTDEYPFDHYRLPRCPSDIPTSYELFSRENPHDGVEIGFTKIPSEFDPIRPTTLLVHGYMNDRNTEYLFQMKDAILSVNDMNVILVGWGGMYDYPVAASSTRTVGAEAALLLNVLVSRGAQFSDFWCVGFSLGAHVCGHVGMRTKQPISRVTGLDPAGPWFEDYELTTGINPDVADFVDIIHTMCFSSWMAWGTLRPLGHMDFYPNGGPSLQPGCWSYFDSESPSLDDMGNLTNTQDFMAVDIACSHGRAVDYFVESILTDCFIARNTCSNAVNIPDSCSECNGGAECARMGYHSRGSGPHGIYYLQTHSAAPFCQG